MSRERAEPPYGDVLLELAVTNSLASEVVDRALRARGVSPSQGGLLALIEENAPVTPTALARIIAMRASTLRDRVNELVRAGYVRRVPHEHDGRSSYLETTAEGRRWLGLVRPVVREVERTLDAELDGELLRFAGSLARVRLVLEKRLSEGIPDSTDPPRWTGDPGWRTPGLISCCGSTR